MRTLLILFVLAATMVTAPDPGEDIFNDLCADCHTLGPPPDIAPPLLEVVDRYLAISASRDEARTAMLAWIADPENETPAMPDSVVAEYGEMPDFGLTPEEVVAITDWLLTQYDEQE